MTKPNVSPPKSKQLASHQRGTEGCPSGRIGWSGRRLWLARGLSVVLVPLVGVILLELLLMGCGVGRPHRFFIPSERAGVVTTNPWFVSFHRPSNSTSPHPHNFYQVKPADTIRIFVLGGSAAMGTPQPAFGFCRILEVMLAPYFPERQVEVINAAMWGIDSQLVTQIAEDCARYQPDLFIVYMGNNDVVGAHGPGTFAGRHPAWEVWRQRGKRLRVSQWLQQILVRQTQEQPQSMESFQRFQLAWDDPQRDVVVERYRQRMLHICETAFAANSAVLLSTVASNLRDFPPLASKHKSTLTPLELQQWQGYVEQANRMVQQGDCLGASEVFARATDLDDQFALLHYQWAQCLLALDELDAARDHFILARDRDALAFRADSRINDVVRDMHTQLQGRPIWMVDVAQDLDPNAIAGHGVFSDHVHFTFRGDYAVANLLMPAILEILREKNDLVAVDSIESLSQSQCALRLGYSRWDAFNASKSIMQMMSQPPFQGQWQHSKDQQQRIEEITLMEQDINKAYVDEVIDHYSQALELAPNDWHLHFHYANLLYTLRRYPVAYEHIQVVVEQFPHYSAFRVLYAYILAGMGNKHEAVQQIDTAKSLDPQSPAVHQAMQWASENGLSGS